MASIATRLWIPSDVSIDTASDVINDTMQARQIFPPFSNELQSILNSVFLEQSNGRLLSYLFRLQFPRGPVVSVEQMPESMARMPNHQETGFALNDPRRFHSPISTNAPNPMVHLASLRRGDTLVRDIHPSELINPTSLHDLQRLTGYRIMRRTRAAAPVRTIRLSSHACKKIVTCAICLNDTELGETVSTLVCGHTFHKKCITPWTQQATTCPTCRHEL
jgi:hypothetical protein